MNITLPAQVNHPGFLFVLVTGGREFNNDEGMLDDALDRVDQLATAAGLAMVVVQGGASGADHIACVWADNQDPPKQCITEHADWRAHGRAAGPRRNQLMIDKHHPDICIAMPGGKGTADMVRRCQAAGIPVFLWTRG